MPRDEGRYKPEASAQTEFEPGSDGLVMRNKLGIVSEREMHQAEFDALLRVQEIYLTNRITEKTRFTAAIIRQLHSDWLGVIYEWAGEYRTVNVAKGGFAWPPAFLVASNMQTFEGSLLKDLTPCVPGPIDEACDRVARVHAEFLLIHPFRDGNGRVSRLLADLMISQAGLLRPDYAFQGPDEEAQRLRYLAAVRQGYASRFGALADFFREGIERAESAGRGATRSRAPSK